MANDKDVELLNLLENKFKNRYTEDDEDYMKLVNKSIPDPPVIHPWSNRNPQRRDNDNHRFHRNDNYGRHHRNDNRNYGGGGYNDNRRYQNNREHYRDRDD